MVDIRLERGGLRVRPARPKKYALKDLLKGITKRNLHGEVPSGAAAGREAL